MIKIFGHKISIQSSKNLWINRLKKYKNHMIMKKPVRTRFYDRKINFPLFRTKRSKIAQVAGPFTKTSQDKQLHRARRNSFTPHSIRATRWATHRPSKNKCFLQLILSAIKTWTPHLSYQMKIFGGKSEFEVYFQTPFSRMAEKFVHEHFKAYACKWPSPFHPLKMKDLHLR